MSSLMSNVAPPALLVARMPLERSDTWGFKDLSLILTSFSNQYENSLETYLNNTTL